MGRQASSQIGEAARVSDRCPRCLPGTLDLGHEAAAHRAARLLARNGWTLGRADELAPVLESELARLRHVGPATAELIRERLPLATS